MHLQSVPLLNSLEAFTTEIRIVDDKRCIWLWADHGAPLPFLASVHAVTHNDVVKLCVARAHSFGRDRSFNSCPSLTLLCQSPLCFLIASGQEILRASEILEQKRKNHITHIYNIVKNRAFPLMSAIDFERLFRLLTGYDPFPWQVALFEQFQAGEFPRSASLPTGLGKTSLIVLWLLACYAALRDDRRDFPRRLYFVINRRTVVDEATSFAAQALARIQAASTPELAEMKNVFLGAAAFNEEKCIGLSTLRGEFADNEEWRVDPSRPAITIGTIDKIGSKLLFAGYGDTPYTRPTAAALTAISSYVVYDEAHLEPAFSALLESIQQFIDREPTSQEPARFGSFHFTELTATPREGTGFQLTQEDHQSEKVQQRIHARKTLTLIPDTNSLTATICAQALQFKGQLHSNSSAESRRIVSRRIL